MTTLTEADAQAIATDCPSVQAVSPIIGTHGLIGGGTINWRPNLMLGVGSDYPVVRNSPLASGAFFTVREVHEASQVCVLGHTVTRQLFPDTDPVGQRVRIKNLPFVVIGVLERKGANMVGRDQDNVVLMPYTTVRKRLQNSESDNVDLIFVSARSEALSARAEQEIRALLTDRHRIAPGEKPDFEIRNTAEVAGVMTAIMGRPDRGPRQHRGHLARGRRCGDHEHHAGLGHRADP